MKILIKTKRTKKVAALETALIERLNSIPSEWFFHILPDGTLVSQEHGFEITIRRTRPEKAGPPPWHATLAIVDAWRRAASWSTGWAGNSDALLRSLKDTPETASSSSKRMSAVALGRHLTKAMQSGVVWVRDAGRDRAEGRRYEILSPDENTN
jgi:hypothetical protein